MEKIVVKKEFFEAIIRSVPLVLMKCIYYETLCFDLPATSTSLLYCLGYNEYFVRKFWETFEELGEIKIPIYRYWDIIFSILLLHRKEAVSHLRYECIPVDDTVCIEHRLDCVKSPHSNVLYIYIEGDHDGRVFVRTNVLRVLRLLYLWNKEAPFKLIKMLQDALNGESDLDSIMSYVFEIISSNIGIIKYILPKVPKDLNEFQNLSPFLRLLNRLRKQTV